MKVAVMRDAAPIRRQWSELAASTSVFLTPEWFEAWWKNYAYGEEPHLVCAFDESDTLLALAPLRQGTQSRYGQTVRTLSFAVDGSNDSEYLDFLAANDTARAALRTWLEQQCAAGAVLLLNEVPETSPNLPMLRAIGSAGIWTEKEVPCATAALPASFDEYLKGLKPRFRTKVRSVLRNLESRADVSFGWCRSIDEAELLLPELFDLHKRRWATEGKPGVFGWDRKRAFYYDLSRAFLERGWLRMSWTAWRGRIIAVQYGFAYNGSYLHLQEGYEPACEHWNIGVGLRAWSIRELIGQGIGEYDFLGGVNRHKTDWGAETKLSRNVQVAASSIANSIFCNGPEWAAQARESVRNVLPESLLALRNALHKADHAWIRQAAASVYVNTGLPSLAAPLRRRYQLSTSPALSLQRRLSPAARILYYHRVHDEADPFFPATPTEVFAAQMEHVARHYRVVTLSELVQRLRDRDAVADLMAITFDDGYNDNYSHALPILERLNLPATIFLTTGALDSGEAMWFEQLAHALKTTGQESIDLEIDVPRRLPLATENERLTANDVIYGVLRMLPDNERTEWLGLILAQLGVERKLGAMLAWRHVRAMRGSGIDFGGHTVTHPFLSRLSADRVLFEAAESKRRIEQEIQEPVLHFAYPSGREDDFGLWNKDVIRQAGYQAAVTTIWGVNDDTTDLMELRRGQPWEENAAMFGYKLDWYQLVNG